MRLFVEIQKSGGLTARSHSPRIVRRFFTPHGLETEENGTEVSREMPAVHKGCASSNQKFQPRAIMHGSYTETVGRARSGTDRTRSARRNDISILIAFLIP
jgi:hypothetical protein